MYHDDSGLTLTGIRLGEHYGGEPNVACPYCGYDYTHIKNVYTELGRDQYEAGVYRGTQVGGRTASRRSALAIAFECEEGHEFILRIQQHKGINLVEMETTKWITHESDPECDLP